MKLHQTPTRTVATFMVFLIAGFNDCDDHVVGKLRLRQRIYANSHPIERLSNERRVSMEAVGNRKVTIGGVKPE